MIRMQQKSDSNFKMKKQDNEQHKQQLYSSSRFQVASQWEPIQTANDQNATEQQAVSSSNFNPIKKIVIRINFKMKTEGRIRRADSEFESETQNKTRNKLSTKTLKAFVSTSRGL